MSGRIVKLNQSVHQQVQELLPWFAMDTLGNDELALVYEHLQECTQCQADADWQRKLKTISLPDTATVNVERAFAALRPKLALPRNQPKRFALSAFVQNFWHGFWNGNPRWMQWALAAQFSVIAGLSILLLPLGRTAADYHGLGMHAGAVGNLVVVFKPETTERELRRILQVSGARVVDGPTVTDAYLLSVPQEQQAGAIHALRSEPAVVLVESMVSERKK